MSTDRPRIVRGSDSKTPQRPWVIGGFFLGLIAGATVTWLATSRDQGVDSEKVVTPAETVNRTEQLNQDLAVAERARQVSENALLALKQTVFELDQEMANQREEVSFYQRLLDAGGSVRGLAVHEFQLTPTTSPQVYRYRLVLTQNLKKTRRVQGAVMVSVTGISNDRAVQLDAADLGVSPPLQAFEFKYYQQLQGTLSLPEGFSPTEVAVRAEIDDSNRSAQEVFPWRMDGPTAVNANEP